MAQYCQVNNRCLGHEKYCQVNEKRKVAVQRVLARQKKKDKFGEGKCYHTNKIGERTEFSQGKEAIEKIPDEW